MVALSVGFVNRECYTMEEDRRWLKNAKWVWGVVGLVLEIVGLAGVPDDLRNWGAAIGYVARVIDQDVARSICALAGLAILLMAFVWPMIRAWGRPRTVKLREPESLEDLIVFRQMARAGRIKGIEPATVLPPKQCPICKGNGRKWGRYEDHCELCESTGELPGELLAYPTCVSCEGSGLRFGKYEQFCDVCKGLGVRLPKSFKFTDRS